VNYHRLFEAEIARFSLEGLAENQERALTAAGLASPT
jgi:hypothetical protein